MRLTTKTGLSFISASAIFFFLGSILMYFSVRIILAEDLKDRLLDMQSNFISNLSLIDDIELLKNNKVFITAQEKYSHTSFTDTVLIKSGSYNLFRKISFSQYSQNKIYRIEILQSQSQTDLLIWRIVILNVGLAMLFFLISFFVNHLTVKRTLKVFYSTISRLENFDVSKAESLDLENAEIDEIMKLNDVFKQMSSKIRTDFDEQKEYTENVSHELQTPLAIISSKAEELLQSNHLNEFEMNQVGIIMNTTNRLAKINQSLIFLTKIDNRFYTDEEDLNISELLNEKLSFFKDLIDEKRIIVTLNMDNETDIRINKYLADTLFLNLIKNSIMHNIEGGILEINLNKDTLIIKNNGAPIKGDSHDVFKRFFRTEVNKESLGIGLSIVKRICDLYNLKITYGYKVLHIFKIKF